MQKIILLFFIFQILIAKDLDQHQHTLESDIQHLPSDFDQLRPALLYNLATDGQAQFTQELDSYNLPSTVQEYGYGFWFRFLTSYPTRLWQGKNADFYFMARLTINQNFGDVAFGDRLLANWQGQGYYHFTTCNTIDEDPNVHTNINYPTDIEGLWTYIYYSHSQVQSKSVGFIQYGNQLPPSSIELDVTHPVITYLNFMVGGQQFTYPGFNGQIYNLVYNINTGAFINNQAQFLEKAGLVPNFDGIDFIRYNQVNEINNSQDGLGIQQYTQIGGGKDAFPKEYSVSGWFKWTGPYVGDWHHLFRLTINDQANNADYLKLGDRDLSVFANRNNFYRCSTYTYSDMIGDGNSDYYQDLQHLGQITTWHFLYFGYNKFENRAFFFFQNGNTKLNLDYPNTNHYLAEKFYFSLIDTRYPNFNGKQALINVNSRKESFLASSDSYFKINDLFQYTRGLQKLVAQGLSELDELLSSSENGDRDRDHV